MKSSGKLTTLLKHLLILLLSALWLVGCADTNPPPSATPTPQDLMILGPDTARNVALAYLRTYHPGSGPARDAIWFAEPETHDSQTGVSALTYRYENWVITVSFPMTTLDQTIYTVAIESYAPGFSWHGQVNAISQVQETAFSTSDQTASPQSLTQTLLPSNTAISFETATPTPQLSVISTETVTPTPQPSAIPTETATPTSTLTPTLPPLLSPCNAALFIRDITIPNGSTFYPGANFIKTWLLRNQGSCTWTADYDLVFFAGDPMGGESFRALPDQVRPGESIELSVPLKAPNNPGDYSGFWMLRDNQDNYFGLDPDASQPFSVNINVIDSPLGDFAYDLARDYCAAVWRSATGRIACPGFSDSSDGFVQLVSSANLENRQEDEPTLWVHPNTDADGFIEGRYPSYKVEEGDHFKAWVGCLQGYNRCDLTFYLDYEDSLGHRYRLESWDETLDGKISMIDLDLSHLSGERIQLILGVQTNNITLDDGQGFWFVPRIE